MSLYTKYRPRDWDSVVSQDYITTILRNSLKSGKVSHAYLFHGSRGTGKTTSARILAKALNCTNLQDGNPCHACENCLAFDNDTMLDIIEIDGASNNGVENVRELIERARFEPNQGKYKIYIIDEVHMLSTGAFNALLKILEEPPLHVKFILATTEIDKVPETIRSRTLRFDFRKITLEHIIARLTYVIGAEGITAEDEAIRIIAKSARGGLRDALTILEQNVIDSEVSTEHVRHTLSLVDDALIESCISALEREDVDAVTDIISVLKERHVQVRSFFDQIMYALRDHLIANLTNPDFSLYDEILAAFESAYSKVKYLPDGMMLIELTLLRIAKRGSSLQRSGDGSQNQKNDRETKVQRETPKVASNPSPKVDQGDQEGVPKKDSLPVNPIPTSQQTNQPTGSPTHQLTSFSYPALIQRIKEIQPAMAIDLKTARFQTEGDQLTLIFSKKWNHDRVNTPSNRGVISDALGSLGMEGWSVICRLEPGSVGNLSSDIHEVF